MTSQVDDLVRMRDIETLFELMAEDEDWMVQLDAAEGLVKLGDKRGLEFLLSAEQSDDDEVSGVAKEILQTPALKAQLDNIRSDEEKLRREKVETAKKRLQKGKKVFRYKMIYFPAGDILNEDPMSEGFEVPSLDEFGFEGWEVVNMIPRKRQTLAHVVDDGLSGAYFLLKREVSPDESAELDEV
ncbi:MAG: HEAT repeat domain-containing protein [Chloroflexota bacterium]